MHTAISPALARPCWGGTHKLAGASTKRVGIGTGILACRSGAFRLPGS
ncbi:hypothetical protein [Kamptonema formosum]|nr:hypothetical protein [Oscillatoria sp. PCC 10802]